MANCIESIAGSIRPNCAHPLTAGYTGRGVLIPYSAITALVQNSDNPRIVESVTAGTVVEIDNTAVTSAFTGSNKASNAESGRKQITKELIEDYLHLLREKGRQESIIVK